MVLPFTRSEIKLLKEINEKGSVTSSTQRSYFLKISFYLAIGKLKKYGLVQQNGFTKSNEKIWQLTEKGKKFVKAYEKLEKMLEAILSEEGK